MDIIELLLLAVFIVLPLIQSLFEKLGRSRRPDLPSEREAEEKGAGAAEDGAARIATSEAPAGLADRDREEEASESWSAGWGRWPSEAATLEDLSAEEVVSEETAEEIVVRQERLEAESTVSEAARVTVPVVSMEPLKVDRSARRSSGAERTRPQPPAAAAVVRSRQAPLLPGLGSRSDLRQAIVLAEVLGPPRALQDTERMGGL